MELDGTALWTATLRVASSGNAALSLDGPPDPR
jgi:hypothetical protein